MFAACIAMAILANLVPSGLTQDSLERQSNRIPGGLQVYIQERCLFQSWSRIYPGAPESALLPQLMLFLAIPVWFYST